MSELTLTIIRLGFLVLLWVFVFSIVGVLRGDLYGTRVVSRTPKAPARRTPAPTTPRPPKQQRPRRGRRGRGEPTYLTVTEGPLAGTSLRLREAGTLIGRSPESALVLDDDFASGRHARIYRAEDGWYVEDLGSTNGTFVGQQRLTAPARVEAGTAVRIGKTVVELRG